MNEIVRMHGILLTIHNIAAWGLPNADLDEATHFTGSSDPYIVFDVQVGDKAYTARTRTVQDGARDVEWEEELRIMLPGPLQLGDLEGAKLHVTVWDEDNTEYDNVDDHMGSVTELIIPELNTEHLRRTCVGTGRLHSFDISFSYELTPWNKARIRWMAPNDAWNVHVCNKRQSVMRKPWYGASFGVAFATCSPMLTGDQDATVSVRIYHCDSGRHCYLGVVAADSLGTIVDKAMARHRRKLGAPALEAAPPDDAGSVVLLNLFSGRCFAGKSAEHHSKMLNGQLDGKSCRMLTGKLDGVLVHMRVDMANRRLLFAVGEGGEWTDAGVELPKAVRPCAILGDDEGSTMTFQDDIISTEKEDGVSRAVSHWRSLWERRGWVEMRGV